jgi:CarD family transcriptional regulator
VFSEEQLVVYPAQGVGRVERIETQVIGGASADFFIVRILSNNVTLMVPVKNAANVGLRPLCTAEQGAAIIESLKDRSDFTGYTGQNWNRRYREYSFGERRLLEQATSLLTLELALALDKDQQDIKDVINEIFADVLQPKPEE